MRTFPSVYPAMRSRYRRFPASRRFLGAPPHRRRPLPLDLLPSDHFSTSAPPDRPRLRVNFTHAPGTPGSPVAAPARLLRVPSPRRPWVPWGCRSFVLVVICISLCCRGASESFQSGILCSTRLRTFSGLSSRRHRPALCPWVHEGRTLGS